MLPDDVMHEIDVLVRTRAHDRKALIEIFCEERYEPGELDPALVEAEVDRAIDALETEEENWPPITDFDRLLSAFAELNQRGVLALVDAGYTQSDGYGDFQDALEMHADAKSVIGYCFYHGQDAEHAVDGEGLFLAFGPTHPRDEATQGAAIGSIVREELERAGLQVEWSGTFSKRICLPAFVWQRR